MADHCVICGPEAQPGRTHRRIGDIAIECSATTETEAAPVERCPVTGAAIASTMTFDVAQPEGQGER